MAAFEEAYGEYRFYLPDGQATPEDGPVETFTLVQNPNSTDVKIEVSYLTPNGKGNVVFTDTVPKNSRRTYNMADRYEGRASVKVVSLMKGKKIMVEQAIYLVSVSVLMKAFGKQQVRPRWLIILLIMLFWKIRVMMF